MHDGDAAQPHRARRRSVTVHQSAMSRHGELGDAAAACARSRATRTAPRWRRSESANAAEPRPASDACHRARPLILKRSSARRRCRRSPSGKPNTPSRNRWRYAPRVARSPPEQHQPTRTKIQDLAMEMSPRPSARRARSPPSLPPPAISPGVEPAGGIAVGSDGVGEGEPGPPVTAAGTLSSASAVPPNAPRLMRPPLGAGSSADGVRRIALVGRGLRRRADGDCAPARSANVTDVERSPVPGRQPRVVGLVAEQIVVAAGERPAPRRSSPTSFPVSRLFLMVGDAGGVDAGSVADERRVHDRRAAARRDGDPRRRGSRARRGA